MTKQSSYQSHRRMDELAGASSSWIASSLTLLAMTTVEVIEEESNDEAIHSTGVLPLNLQSFAQALDKVIHTFLANLPLLCALLLGLWVLHAINYMLQYRLNHFGIIPRHTRGLLGIFFAPFLHANVRHLLMNSLMLFVLSAMIASHGRVFYFLASIYIIVISGLLTWLLARPGVHIGASGLVMGYFGLLISNSISRPSWLSIALAVLCLYYFASLFINLLPQDKHVSWEGHIFGFVSGVLASFLF